MEMTQGGGHAQPTNFTANDYCTGIHLAAGIVLALLGRARGVAVSIVEASLMMTATVFQSEHVAEIAARRPPRPTRSAPTGADRRPGATSTRRRTDGSRSARRHRSRLAALGAAFAARQRRRRRHG